MKKRYVSLMFVGLVALCSVFLFGCKHETIKFYRESAATTVINKFAPQKQKAKVNAGVIILKEELTLRLIIGCILIFISVVCAQIDFKKLFKK